MVILRGALDRQKLVDSLTAPESQVESESYGALEILKLRITLPFLTLKVPVAFLDETTGVFAISLSPEHSSEAELKAVLDHVGESKPGFLADTAILELFQRIPTGVAMVVDVGCQALGRYEGCQRTATSAVPEADYGVVHWVFEFSTSEAAQAAPPHQQARDSRASRAFNRREGNRGVPEGEYSRDKGHGGHQ